MSERQLTILFNVSVRRGTRHHEVPESAQSRSRQSSTPPSPRDDGLPQTDVAVAMRQKGNKGVKLGTIGARGDASFLSFGRSTFGLRTKLPALGGDFRHPRFVHVLIASACTTDSVMKIGNIFAKSREIPFADLVDRMRAVLLHDDALSRPVEALISLVESMKFYVGTSGYSYKEWKGTFYPEKLPQKEMLSFYAQRFSSVEINNSFYKMPTAEVIESWAEQTPDSFQFVFKAPQTITHRRRLKDADAEVETLLDSLSSLKTRQGPILFQLPPNMKKDLARLDNFLTVVGERASIAFEFRHESWFDDEIFDCLGTHSCALCVADAEDLPSVDLVSTTDWGYVRLRREDYTDKGLKDWIKRINAQPWKSTYVFFKHEDTGTGPKFADRFLELADIKS